MMGHIPQNCICPLSFSPIGEMMKIVIFGASRGTGLKVLEQALADGHTVTAFVRSLEKFTLEHENLKLIQGDVLDASAVEQAVSAQDAVISTLAPTRPPVPGMMEMAARNIVNAMKKNGIRRLISTTGAGVSQMEDQPKFVDRFIGFLLNLLAKQVVLDSVANVRVIKASGLDWTIVRFPRLLDGPRTGSYRVGYVGKDSGTQLSRADGADFILKELVEGNWLQKSPVVSY
jgi:putative NADH-flavin reductase